MGKGKLVGRCVKYRCYRVGERGGVVAWRRALVARGRIYAHWITKCDDRMRQGYTWLYEVVSSIKYQPYGSSERGVHACGRGMGEIGGARRCRRHEGMEWPRNKHNSGSWDTHLEEEDLGDQLLRTPRLL